MGHGLFPFLFVCSDVIKCSLRIIPCLNWPTFYPVSIKLLFESTSYKCQRILLYTNHPSMFFIQWAFTPKTISNYIIEFSFFCYYHSISISIMLENFCFYKTPTMYFTFVFEVSQWWKYLCHDQV